MKLIDADALLKHAGIFEVKACARGCGNSILNFAKAWLWNEVNIAPTIDAVHVVRCGQCKFDNLCCRNVGKDGKRTKDDFCSYGERREDS